MKTNLKVVSTTTGNANTVAGIVQSIANEIKNGEYPKEKSSPTIVMVESKITKGRA